MPRLTEVTMRNARPGAYEVLLADGAVSSCASVLQQTRSRAAGSCASSAKAKGASTASARILA